MVANEILHYMKKKRTGMTGVAAIKIDILKAYDKMEWAFIEGMLRKLGFCDR